MDLPAEGLAVQSTESISAEAGLKRQFCDFGHLLPVDYGLERSPKRLACLCIEQGPRLCEVTFACCWIRDKKGSKRLTLNTIEPGKQ